MENLKKLTLFMITTIVTVFLIIWSLRSFGFHSPIAALVVNWMILSSIATVTLLAHLSFPSVYYDAKPFGYVAVNGWLDALIWILLFDVLINIYPIILQRYNCIKLQELICKQND